jgi:nucleoid-associated protein YgaU
VLCSLAVLVTILVIMAVPRFVPGAGRPAEKPVAGLAATAPAAERPGGTVAQTQTRREPQLELSLPAGSPVEASEYVVREGDTLWSIARRFTGNPFNYPRIAGENRIADPDLIFPGQRIRLTREKAPAAGADR